MSLRRWTGLAFTSSAIVLGGYGIMLLVTPTEEQLKSRMSPELRKKYDAMEEERVKRKEKVFEHIKYNMNSDRPIWDVQWDRMKEEPIKYPPVRTNIPPPRKREARKSKAEENASSSDSL